MKITGTWYGTAALHLVVDEALGVFFDPWFARPPTARPQIAADPATVDLQPLDVILASHSHFDHIINLPDLVRRYPLVQAYVPAATVRNCRKLCSGAIFKEYSCPLTDGAWARIHTVTAGDCTEASSRGGSVRLRATAIRSGHVRFDAHSVLRVVFNFEVIRRLGYYSKFLVGFPMKEVLGWEVQLESGGESKRIVFFGSLCKKYAPALRQYTGCDYAFLPLAGRKNILPYASVVTEVLQPRVVVPVHHDDFFPPVSYPVDYRNYAEWLKKSMPGTKLLELPPEQPTVLPV
ncbi:MAG: MBL fold metallo-hydrolase [Methanomicrobiales archaeon]|nr:MBL fold metallo-hydrolase [Methanomicrobiales archaeon]